MPTLSQTRHPLHSTVLSLTLAAGLCLASAGAATAAEHSAAPGGPATAIQIPDPAPVAGGPSWRQKSVDFSHGRINCRDTASGFDATGAAYFEQRLVTVGGPEGFRYTVTRSHS
ncbi:hypothetical protein ACIREE_25770 [Streptomyces sp. NPDC102467]|uniref:hypothetical protein n=1 Tax=Streptomyces sp. NPDC102467 TaxID=3366179 RepID=UPI00380B09A3